MKAILVLDEMPKSCANCRLKRGLFCGESGNSLHDYVNINLKPSWCPLKPLPSKDFWHKKDYADGWNACIDELLGEAE